MKSKKETRLMMSFGSLRAIEAAGYSGFAKIADLMTSCRNVTPSPGTYMVLRSDRTPPVFLPPVVHDGRLYNSTVPVKDLEANWVPGAIVVYIGKSTSVRNRVRQYMRTGQGLAVNHQGGRYIWQLADHLDLVVCWKPSEGDPRETEVKLIAGFVAAHGRRPFANLAD
jgi:hypothetical protein